LGAIDGVFGRWALALELFLQCLAAHDVLGLSEVVEDVEVLQALELVEQFASPLDWLPSVPGGLGLEGL
jgi:hypothetical protein